MLLLLFALAQPPVVEVEAKPVITKPTLVTASVGELVRLKGTGVWELPPNVLAADIVETKTGVAFVASKEGTYTFVCYAGTKPAAWVTVTVGNAGPVVPPTPPVPVETLESKIKAAYAANTSATKKADTVQLSAFYSATVGQKFAQDTTVKTAGELIAKIKVTAVLDATKLVEIRKLIGSELLAIVKTADTPLTSETRAKIVTLFAEIERVLDALV